MKEKSPMAIGWRPVLAHAATVAVTLMLVAVLFGDRLGLRRPPLAQIPGRPSELVPPAPQPIAPSSRAVREPGAGTAGSRSIPPPPEDLLEGLDPDERNNIRVYTGVNRSVVNITTEAEGLGFFGDETSTGGGSGFVLDKAGHILTNCHVIQEADSVRVKLFDGSAHDARIIGADLANDVAVLKVQVPAEKLVPVKFGDSSKVMVGQKILALGNPFGLERTLTSGIVSSLDRSFRAKNGRMIKGIIQTDAAINPGNSGGPLLNSRGEVIGMNTAIVSQVGQSAGISFAVPINAIARVLPQLIENGRVIRADLGVTRVYTTGEGLLVLELADGGAAERAGIQPIKVRVERGAGFMRQTLLPESADMIVAIDHKRVHNVDELLTEIEKHRPGEIVRVTVVRDSKPIDIRVQLGQS
jgi:S1-C subfamily serine protease